MHPELKFSSFLKKIPQNNKENPIDKIIQEKPINNHHDFNTSDVYNSGKQTGNEVTIAAGGKDKLTDFNQESTQAKKKDEHENPANEIQYFEREISIEEESRLRSALTNHFMFQDLNEEIMYYILNDFFNKFFFIYILFTFYFY